MTRPQKDGFEFYFALDTHCKVRDYAIRNDTGEGFEQFIQRNVEGQRSGGNYPDYWLFQYTIPDDVLLRIRQQERLIGPDFLQTACRSCSKRVWRRSASCACAMPPFAGR